MAYTPRPFTYSGGEISVQDVLNWAQNEFQAIAREISGEKTDLALIPLAKEPAKYHEGMVVSADGANWDPGAGRGLYHRQSGAWVKL